MPFCLPAPHRALREPRKPRTRPGLARMPKAGRIIVAFLQHRDFVFSRTDRRRRLGGRPSRHVAPELRAFIASIRFCRRVPACAPDVMDSFGFSALRKSGAMEVSCNFFVRADVSIRMRSCPAFLRPPYPPTIPSVRRTERRALSRRPNRPGLAERAGCGKDFGSDHARRKEMPCDSPLSGPSRPRVLPRPPSPRPRREKGVANARRRPRRFRPTAPDRRSADGHERVSQPHGRRLGRGSGRRA